MKSSAWQKLLIVTYIFRYNLKKKKKTNLKKIIFHAPYISQFHSFQIYEIPGSNESMYAMSISPAAPHTSTQTYNKRDFSMWEKMNHNTSTRLGVFSASEIQDERAVKQNIARRIPIGRSGGGGNGHTRNPPSAGKNRLV